MHTFPTPGHVRLRIRTPGGSIEIRNADIAETTVEITPLRDDARAREFLARATIGCTDHAGGHDVVVELPDTWSWRGRGMRFDVRITAPRGADVDATTADASVTVDDAGAVRVRSATGPVHAERCATAKIEAASGDVTIGSAAASVDLSLVSGDATVGEARTASVRSVSGDIHLQRVGPGETVARSVSGDVTIGVIPDAAVWLDTGSVSGHSISDLGPGAPPTGDEPVVELRVKTVSGDIHVRRAQPVEA
jgi:hypothetical protein